MSQDLAHIRKVKDAHTENLASRPGVTGIDIGPKYVGGRETDEIVIRVHVEKKKDVPPDQRIPETLDGIKTDVLETRFKLVSEDDAKYATLQGGISIGRLASAMVGTFGAVTIDNATGTRMALTNYHVICHSDGSWVQGNLATQPGSLSVWTVGPLTRAVFQGAFDKAQAGSVDAAVAGIEGGAGALPPRPHASCITEIGPIAGGSDSFTGVLRKRGRTSGLTAGTQDGAGDYELDGSKVGLGKRWFKDLRLIKPTGTNIFDKEGDSGSAIVNASNEIVGLLVGATEADASGIVRGVATPIRHVLSAMNVSIATVGLFADIAGWNEPQYYSTIQTAVYNGQLLLLARGAGEGGLQVYTWDPNAQRFGPPVATGLFTDASGWYQEKYYSTIRAAVYNNQLWLLARGSGGLEVYRWNGVQFVSVPSAALFPDSAGWDQPQYYSTIQTVVHNGQWWLLARGAGGGGLLLYQWNDAQQQFGQPIVTNMLSVDDGWGDPKYYSTIQTVEYNNQLWLLARGAGDGGLQIFQWNDAQRQFGQPIVTHLFPVDSGWGDPKYYSTIQTVVYDGQLWLLARGAGAGGLQIYQWNDAQRGFNQPTATQLFPDSAGWDQPQYYSTIQAVVFNNELRLLARGAGEGGLLTYQWDGRQAFVLSQVGNAPVVGGLFADAGGWNRPEYYSTIQTVVDANNSLLLLARGAGDAGLTVYEWSASRQQFTFRTQTQLFTDADGWNKPQYYSTIQTVLYNGALWLMARGSGEGGLLVYRWNDVQKRFDPPTVTHLFPDAEGWDEAPYYSTIQATVYNSRLFLLARGAGPGGLVVYQWDDAQQKFIEHAITSLFPEDAGWNQPEYYSTIQTVVVSGQLLLLARGAGPGGLMVYQWNDGLRKFNQIAVTQLFTDDNGWKLPEYYSTIQTAVHNDRLLLLARSADPGGLQVYEWNGTQFNPPTSTKLFTNAGGWDQPQCYSTIQTVEYQSELLLFAREAGDGGLTVYRWEPAKKFTLVAAYNTRVTQNFFTAYSAQTMGLFCRRFDLTWPG